MFLRYRVPARAPFGNGPPNVTAFRGLRGVRNQGPGRSRPTRPAGLGPPHATQRLPSLESAYRRARLAVLGPRPATSKPGVRVPTSAACGVGAPPRDFQAWSPRTDV